VAGDDKHIWILGDTPIEKSGFVHMIDNRPYTSEEIEAMSPEERENFIRTVENMTGAPVQHPLESEFKNWEREAASKAERVE